MSRVEIEEIVGRAIERTVRDKTDAPKFKWTLVPSKSLAEDGLGLGWNAWHIVLHYLAAEALPKTRPYTSLQVGPLLIRDTHTKTLMALRYALTERLLVITAKSFSPL